MTSFTKAVPNKSYYQRINNYIYINKLVVKMSAKYFLKLYLHYQVSFYILPIRPKYQHEKSKCLLKRIEVLIKTNPAIFEINKMILADLD